MTGGNHMLYEDKSMPTRSLLKQPTIRRVSAARRACVFSRIASMLIVVSACLCPVLAMAAPTEPVRQGPVPLKPGAHGVGRLVPAVPFKDLSGAKHAVGDQPGYTLFAATGTSCPLSVRYLPTLVEIAESAPEAFGFVLINPTATDDPGAMRRDADRLGDHGVYVHDADGSLSEAIGLSTTTDVVIIDTARTVVYHGAVDDQYGFGYALDAPRHTYLQDALADLAAGREPSIAATDSPGCELETATPAPASVSLTYHGEIARLVQRHCTECHRDGGVGPFALDSYDDLVAHAGMVREVVRRGTMPPWFAAGPTNSDEAEPAPLTWANERSLASSEKAMLLAWLDGQKTAGDPTDAPQPRTYPDGWLIGEPDRIWEFAEPQAVKATGVMPYQNVIVETGLTEDRWVQSIEIRPGSPEVVHHVLVHVLPPGSNEIARDEREGYWAVYVPGQSVHAYPEGFARKLPAGARLNFQMHYTPNGTATTDSTRIGVVFCDEPEHEVRTAGIVNTQLAIPPGASNHREVASITLPTDATVLSYLPHMHLRGKACRYELTHGGETTTLLDVPRYDFNWQLIYQLAKPLPLSAGDRLTFTAWFDNSTANPANPDPTETVHWGPQTFEEMHLGYVEYFLPGVAPGREPGDSGWWGQFVQRLRSTDLKAAFERLDADQNGQLSTDELPDRLRERLMRLDLDKNGSLSREEAALLRRR
jgi:mono/diheme cytochrome c family protein